VPSKLADRTDDERGDESFGLIETKGGSVESSSRKSDLAKPVFCHDPKF
jgi:hypothetical protein